MPVNSGLSEKKGLSKSINLVHNACHCSTIADGLLCCFLIVSFLQQHDICLVSLGLVQKPDLYRQEETGIKTSKVGLVGLKAMIF